jgi:hypothetical protein
VPNRRSLKELPLDGMFRWTMPWSLLEVR